MASYRDWISNIDINIDYYSAFIKAWIAFNAWYRSEYAERTDREIIEKLKTQNNRFKVYIETLLDISNSTEDALSFRSNLSKLQSALVNAAITTQERGGVNQQISFAEIAIINPKLIAEGDYRTTHYKIQRTGQKVCTIIHKKNDPGTKYFCLEQERYDETALEVHTDFRRLGTEQQGQCKAFYMEIRPYLTESILIKDKGNNVIFVEERVKVSRGLIEVLYLLRCSLMHGEVTPDNNSSEVYKYAYHVLTVVLRKFI